MKCRVFMALFILSASAFAQNAATLDETAHFLAGMPVTGALEPLTHDPAWQEHAQAMNEAWTRKEQQQIGRVARGWKRIGPSMNGATITFSNLLAGPVFSSTAIFFPLRTITFMLGSN